MTTFLQNYSSEEDHTWLPSTKRSKRIKTNAGHIDVKRLTPPPRVSKISLDSLFDVPLCEMDFEEIFPKEDYLYVRRKHLENSSETDAYGYHIRPLTAADILGLREWLDNKVAARAQNWTTGDSLLSRRLQLHKLTRHSLSIFREDDPHIHILRYKDAPLSHASCYDDTISALNSIRRTPYEISFMSRLKRDYPQLCGPSHVIHRDCETRAPWMELLSDIRLHYFLSHPDCEQQHDIISPIDYVSLQRWHLPQVHDLLSRAFWPGIDVSDSLQYSPTKCTIVSVYRLLVVGAAFLSSPEEAYLTYLVVRPGWENINIATVMLYHLITANPGRDITLHVSANNPAMLLYNKFGFKAEEFVVGFYEDYLSDESRTCKNAFRLRLRR